MKNTLKDFSPIKTDDFSAVRVGDKITLSKKGKRYSNVEVKGSDRRRWVSARKVGMRWQRKGVGVIQLKIEGFILHEINRPVDESDSNFLDSALESISPRDAENAGFFVGWFSGRASRKENTASGSTTSAGVLTSSSSPSSSSSSGGFWSELGDFFGDLFD